MLELLVENNSGKLFLKDFHKNISQYENLCNIN